MEDSVVAIAGDLILEKQKLSDLLRRIEGASRSGALESFMDQARSSLDRVSQLSKTLIYIANARRSIDAGVLFESLLRHLEALSGKLVKPIQVSMSGSSIKFEKHTVERIRPLLCELLDSCLEFGIESSRERMARKKTVAAKFVLSLASDGDGVVLDVRYDGNGLEPPVPESLGENLAWLGAAAEFTGVPGSQSRWRVWIPNTTGPISGYAFEVDGRVLCIPKFSVERMVPLPESRELLERAAPTWCAFGEALNQFYIDPRFPGNYGDAALMVRSGLKRLALVVKKPSIVDDVFVRPLDAKLNANGRFLGVISPDGTNNLGLVVNAAYLIYGEKSDARILSEAQQKIMGDSI